MSAEYKLYDEETAEGIRISDYSVELCLGDKIISQPLRESDRELSPQDFLETFRVLDYFPDQEFVSPGGLKELKLSLSIDYVLDNNVSGICETLGNTKEANIWEAEKRDSTLFEDAKLLPAGTRRYLPKDMNKELTGWVFYSPFLYTGIYKDRVLRQRVLVALESMLYRFADGRLTELPHIVYVNNRFSKESPAWNYNIPVLEP